MKNAIISIIVGLVVCIAIRAFANFDDATMRVLYVQALLVATLTLGYLELC